MVFPSVALLAGGLATRLGRLGKDRPKSLVEVAGRPFIDHQMELLAAQGVTELVVCAGHLGGMIQEHVGDGSRFGLKARFSFDGPRPLGTGGALKQALPLLSDPFFTLYGDSYLEEPLRGVAEAWASSEKPALMTVYENRGSLEPSNVRFSQGQVLAYDKENPSPDMWYIDYGLGVFSKECLKNEPSDAFDLGTLQRDLAKRGLLAGFEVKARFFEIGTPESLAETERHLLTRS